LAGDFAFVSAMGGPDADRLRAVAIDAAGNFYVTGATTGTADFDPGPGVTALTSAGSVDVCIAKYSATNQLLWAHRIGGSGVDQGFDLALDPSGNVWVVGQYSGTVDFDPGPGTVNQTGGDFVLKLDCDGNFLWAGAIDGSGEDIRSLAIDSAGNVLIAGAFRGTGDLDPGSGTFNLTAKISSGGTPTNDAFLTKIRNDGSFLWAKAWGGASSASGLGFVGDVADDVSVDAAGNVYVFGSFAQSADLDPGPATLNVTAGATNNSYVSKFDPSGNLLWGRIFFGAETLIQNGLAVDAAGNVYTTGGLQNATDFDPGPGVANLASTSGVTGTFLCKLDTNGLFQWAEQFGGASATTVRAFAIAVDANSDVYLTGSFRTDGVAVADFDPGPNSLNLTSNGSITTCLFPG